MANQTAVVRNGLNRWFLGWVTFYNSDLVSGIADNSKTFMVA